MPELQFRTYKSASEGMHRFKVDAVSEIPGKFGPSLQWKCKTIEDSEEGDAQATYLTSAQFGPGSKTHKFLIVLGLTEELSADVNMDPSDFVGQEFYGKVEITVAKEKEYSNIVEVWSVEEFEKMLNNVVAKKTVVLAGKPTVPTASTAPAAPIAEGPNVVEDAKVIEETSNTAPEQPAAPKKINPFANKNKAATTAPAPASTNKESDLAFPTKRK